MSGASPSTTLNNTLDLARRTEALGYHRYWLAEHHNTPSIASSSPAVLIGQIAAATSTLRVGAGGVMLPNHQPLVVAEQFGTLASFHPGRIDLGLGRAAGTDPLTAQALRRGGGQPHGDDFREQIDEVLGFLGAGRRGPVAAYPQAEAPPPVWVLGSSPGGGRLAGELGLPFATAHHFSPQNTVNAVTAYRRSFRPTGHAAAPYAIVAALVIVGEDDARARRLASSVEIAHLELFTGNLGPYLSPEEADRTPYSPQERQLARDSFAPQLIGGPETVRRAARKLLAESGADELMAMTIIHDHAARVRSYELLAEAFADVPAAVPTQPAALGLS
ncbi:LLM class flavin-dependent oxidoreductase [Frankia sp. CNm7]|uniref:LLM class flavin-dependent oxidoreductase n=2 Tax=Frankia nepalensis TaxID=1836974 RepID=A0A937RJ76_9ACTN|nr:LLM class flavin-dependent oxidoreductase [Frankia nepalensis]MBL7511793.1 LLM class flavin-dependent oxidoreductase [Frankia nepalensis]MBL7518604.1 LLM class flavin-dependent oxidoreductase [Frankia nepalensis]MBL7633261.1 LLM class flavin-dependent oxidoreductase [Frankia nepalensis]